MDLYADQVITLPNQIPNESKTVKMTTSNLRDDLLIGGILSSASERTSLFRTIAGEV